MAALLANMIKRGTRKFADVPANQQDAVRKILTEQGRADLIT